MLILEYSLDFSDTTGSLWFYSKDEATNFNANIVDANDFKYFRNKAKLLGNTISYGANEIIRNTTIAVPSKYLSNCWRLLGKPLVNCKVELKLRWMNPCVFSAAGADDDDANSNNINFIINDRKLYVPVVTLSAKKQLKTVKFSYFLDLKDQWIWMNMKQVVRIKAGRINIKIFLSQTL